MPYILLMSNGPMTATIVKVLSNNMSNSYQSGQLAKSAEFSELTELTGI